MSPSRKRIRNRAVAIFGGTFDPVHYGHLRAAAEISERLKVSDFRLVPAGRPPHREGTWAEAFHRLAMLELAVAPYSDLHVDAREVLRSGPSFMVDTLASVRAEVPGVPLLLCVGQDAANHLDRWDRWQHLLDLAHLVVMTRPRSAPAYPEELAALLDKRRVSRARELMDSPAGLVCHVEVTQLAISSTDIRHQLGRGWDPRFLLPATVLSYIRKHGLYGSGRGG
ncbi:MAG: nicotinate-nucleotide adenylyltransferase [Wenzhouxiangella sp.]|jgi:nicotinate-nucleotide adenylyltransferase|nr:nicotinate-nucleotide adenylyltransferase [Wenzhouxiangella sp.]